MDRLERLVNLVAALLDAPRPLSRAELQARVGGYRGDAASARRTFERDKDELRQMGLPLVTETLDAHSGGEDQTGYRIPRDRYELADPGLTEAELTALRMAGAAVRLDAAWGSDATTQALRKLAAAGVAPPPASPAPSSVAPEPAGTSSLARSSPSPGASEPAAGLAELGGGEAVAVVFGAIVERRRLRLRYRGEDRELDPWHLAYRRGQWYLSAFDHHRGEERMFRLDRVEGTPAPIGSGGAFTPPETPPSGPVSVGGWRLGDGPATTVVVRVDAVQAPFAVAAAGADSVVARDPDGSVDVALEVRSRDGLHSWVLGFLDHAEILSPPEVRAEFVARLEGVAAGAGS